MYRSNTHFHFVGIGGIGMSSIAKILALQGYTITGCDNDTDQKSVRGLQNLGCSIWKGHNRINCFDSSINIMIYSSAINQNSEELVAAKSRAIPVIGRALMLAELMRTKYSIAVSGAHGKTTTTALITHILLNAGYNPSALIGGYMKNIKTNALLGSGKFLVAEADESDRSMLHLKPTLALITNIDREHLDVYKDLSDIQQSFKKFLDNLPFYGKAFICQDDQNSRPLLEISNPSIITYGLSNSAHIYATNISLNQNECFFEVIEKSSSVRENILLSLAGKHNLYNALGAIAVARELEIPFSVIKQALSSFEGVERRFSYRGNYQGAELFEDYGHHPEEIKNTLIIARKKALKKLVVIFQPHRYSRMEKLWQLFLETFCASEIDELIVTDIYAASEQPIDTINGENFVRDLKNLRISFPVDYVPFQYECTSLKEKLRTSAQNGALILVLGAGNINILFNKLPSHLP